LYWRRLQGVVRPAEIVMGRSHKTITDFPARRDCSDAKKLIFFQGPMQLATLGRG
jgi:hypothetical protein